MQPVTIQQPAPCHESWAAMTPTAQGRHCAACQTEVVDFTRMTDAEVVAFLRHTTPGNRCGQFREDQLGRPLLPAARPLTGWRRWVGAAVLLLGSVIGMKARAQAAKPTTNERLLEPAAVNPTHSVIPDSLFLVQGVVRNRWGMRTEGVRVTMRNAGISTKTDARGHFSMLVPQRKRGTIQFMILSYYDAPNNSSLMAKVPFKPNRTRPYHIRLRKAPPPRNPGFY